MKKSLYYYIQTTATYLKKLFFHGLFTLLPAIITIGLLHLIWALLKSWLAPIYHAEPELLHRIPHSEILLAFVLIIATGILYELFLKPIIVHIEGSILKKIPLLSLIYFGIKRLTEALMAHDKHELQQVMLVPFPAPGTYSIGFLTSPATPAWAPELEGKFLGLFVPHTPNPTTGFYIIVPAEQCIPLSITRQEAMTLVISGGLMPPANSKTVTEKAVK